MGFVGGKQMDGKSSSRDIQESILHDQSSKPHNLPFEYLKEITDNFSKERVLGKGGFGVVFKGVQQDGETIAVKKLWPKLEVQDKQFENELYHLNRLKHPNIVLFVGYCCEIQRSYEDYCGERVLAEMPQMLLCLEYLPNGSLDKHLEDESRGLDWCKRYNIIKGICRGLHYLHEGWQINTPIVHMDLKPANILLDENMVPKIADFGLSRLFGEQQTRIWTENLKGSFGYMAREYIDRGIITTKSDIFSLGVIIIEIITGHKNYPSDTGTSCRDFVELVLKNWRIRLEATPCNTSLETDYQQIRSCLEIGLSCVESDRRKRPATREIIQRLNKWECTTLRDQQGILIKCICQDLGFSDGRPIAACIIYRCLLHWKSFEAETTDVFTHIIASMVSTRKAQGNDKLAYWLSNSSTLLLFVQRTLKTTAAARFNPPRLRLFNAILNTIFELKGNRDFGGKGYFQQVEAKRPALFFKQHLTAFLKKVYEMIRDNLMEEIFPLCGCCIQAPRISQALFDHWQSIVNILTDHINVLKSNYVPSFLISSVFTQVFSFINAELFNSLLLSECSSPSNGEYVKAGLAKLERWCIYETEKYAGSSWEHLRHIRQAVVLLTIQEKQKLTLKEITCDLCPVLSIPQLYRISMTYRDDKYGTCTVSPVVLSSMESLMIQQGWSDSSDAENNSLLLNVDSTSIPFSADDIPESVTEFELTDVDMPPLMREYACFNFLYQRTD